MQLRHPICLLVLIIEHETDAEYVTPPKGLANISLERKGAFIAAGVVKECRDPRNSSTVQYRLESQRRWSLNVNNGHQNSRQTRPTKPSGSGEDDAATCHNQLKSQDSSVALTD